MEHQDWTIVTMKRTPKKAQQQPYHAQSNYPSSYGKSESLDMTYVPKKTITMDSLQTIIRKRMELKLNQEKADQLCGFPVNTFKNIESKRLVPTEKHQTSIQKYLGVQLKITKV